MIRLSIMGLLVALLLSPALAFEPREFDDRQQADDYRVLINELRCLVCQGQNIADSNAPLAQDMRSVVYRELKQGKSREEVRRFMIDRFGDTISYRPPVQSNTLLLWLTPGVLFFVGMVVVWRVIRSRQPQSPS